MNMGYRLSPRRSAGRARFLASTWFRPRLEILEDRTLLAAVSWVAPVSGFWDVGSNWSTGQVPGSGDDVAINQPGVTVTVRDAEAVHSVSANDPLALNAGSLTLASSSQLNSGLTVAVGATLTSNGTTTVNSFELNGGTVAADSGSLVFSGDTNSTGGSFVVGQGATVDLTGGTAPTYTGTYTGSGAGQVQLNSGALAIGVGGATFDFAKGMFQWTGGSIGATLSGGATLTNTGFMSINSSGGVALNNVPLTNQGEIDDAGTGNVALNTTLDNQANATFVLQNTGGLTGGTFSDEGTLKMTGSGTATVGSFELNGGTVAADSGTLVLSGDNPNTGGSFVVGQGASVDLTGGTAPAYTGTYTGSGAGQVQLNSGSLTIGGGGATFDFPKGMFQWTGGTMNNAFVVGTLTNTGSMTASR
jgi:fibronectin-binding autotransporter adhesin